MRNLLKLSIIFLVILTMESCKTESKKTIEDLKTNIVNDISKIDGDVAIALYDLNNESNTITININEV